jgi:hypothetical protein
VTEPTEQLAKLEGVRLKWILRFWDRPRSGIAEFGGRLCYFDAGPYEEEMAGRFLLYPLNEAEAAIEREAQDLFESWVGTHWTIDTDGRRIPGELKPRAGWSNYYDSPLSGSAIDLHGQPREPRKIDLTGRDPVGWFDVPRWLLDLRADD